MRFLKVHFLPSCDRCSLNFVYYPAVFPAQQPAVTNSSSSEDEAARSPSTVVRRRRVRKNTTSVTTEPEEEEALESGPSEDEEEEEEEVGEETQQREQAEVRPAAALEVQVQGQGSSVLNKCILLALIVAISMGFGHFYGNTLRLYKSLLLHNVLSRCVWKNNQSICDLLLISPPGTVQIQERHKIVEKVRVNELDSVRDLLQQHVQEQHFTNQVSDAA